LAITDAHLAVWLAPTVKAALVAPFDTAPSLSGPTLVASALGHVGDAVLEQLGNGQAEKIGHLPQIDQPYAALAVKNLADPRPTVTAPYRQRPSVQPATIKERADVLSEQQIRSQRSPTHRKHHKTHELAKGHARTHFLLD
jgi:plasmid maintenance system antidote protein VapI